MTQDTYEELKDRATSYWETRSNGDTPLIRIGTAMCGHAAGAFRVADRLKTVLSERSIEANFDEVGCLGLCYAEPLLDIKKPGRPRIFFNNVSSDDVEQIIEDYLINDLLSESRVLGYMGEGEVTISKLMKVIENKSALIITTDQFNSLTSVLKTLSPLQKGQIDFSLAFLENHFLLYFFSFSKLYAQLFRELLSDSNSLISGVFLCPGSSQEEPPTFDI